MSREVPTLFADSVSEVGVVHMFWALLCQYAFGYGEYVRSSRICLCAGRSCLGTSIGVIRERWVFECGLFAAEKLSQSSYPDSQLVELVVQVIPFSFHTGVLIQQCIESGLSVGLKLGVEHSLGCLFFAVCQR